ncbi:DUF4124 domain-containing protein [Thalassolituus hydrocarboniclasticus]|uniref:DUF4124 domain-containing protein n=1 Tax=Thalassolituus hydrocarboniclasticus TaxID=2742796 RepID=A0ABY6A6Q3_9GAMM|nr:DUF4124 domain-containing protein [Thalassolituus hydrocarboniclasticus]UXD86661.1 DUF4124 domain-containing protein [Thalassolituus hydrocarboniclasticus]
MRFFTAFFALLLATASLTVQADKMYRWVDENGQTHFSNLPPADKAKNAEEYKVRVSKPADKVDGYQISTDKVKETTTEASESSEPKVSKAEAEAACAKARKHKETVSTNYSTRFKQEDGEYRPLTDDQRAKQIKLADEQIAKYCNMTFSNKTRNQ